MSEIYPTCKKCGRNELPLTDDPDFDGLCVACECQVSYEIMDDKINQELAILSDRLNDEISFEEFIREVDDSIFRSHLEGLTELTAMFDDVIAQREHSKWEREYLQDSENDLPF